MYFTYFTLYVSRESWKDSSIRSKINSGSGGGVYVCVYIYMQHWPSINKWRSKNFVFSFFWFCSLFRFPGVSHFLNNFSLLDMSLYIAYCFQSCRWCLENNFDIQGCMVFFPDFPNHKSIRIFVFTFVLLKCFHALARISAVMENLSCQLA